ncbi:MAG: polynucleotide adenylyltransferase PcnB [Acidobacteriota bacterium]|nr:polynucleotide adenylyltransferase PcnB [Acidobacteriota bacterium]
MSAPSSTGPRVFSRSEHRLSRKKLDENAVKVLYRLHRAGHKAYLVGGGVRDVLLDRRPKDYDVATSARPQEVRRLFRNSRIIGRRFRLAHVYFHGGIVEVSTFRRSPDPDAQESGAGDLLITDDNVFGSPEEDAFRRDLTINALFYNIGDYSVIDYVGGIDDLQKRIVRIIGDPDLRFREDPIRMTRACELAARLGFTIDSETQEGIRRQAGEILKSSTARLTEEIGQMLRCGHSGTAIQWMLELGLLDVVLPEATALLETEARGLGDYSKTLTLFDSRVAAKQPLSEIGLFSALLLPTVLLHCAAGIKGDSDPLGVRRAREKIAEAIEPFFRRFVLSKHKAEQVVQTILGLHQLRRRRWQTPERVRFSQRPYFDDALFLLESTVEATGEGSCELQRWRRLAQSRPVRREPTTKRGPRRGRRRRRRRAGRRAS